MMKIVPIAFDSLGTRGMATLVETADVRILIDPSVALAPVRYSLPPHPLETERMMEHWHAIEKAAEKADVLVVTHYHYDHHSPEEPWLYEGKRVLLKHPSENINQSQKQRAAFFIQQLADYPEKIEHSDGRRFDFGNTRIAFSSAVPHGTNARLGYVTEVLIDDGAQRFLHTSDVEGPALEEQVRFILQSRPNVLFVDGPMTYMLGYRYSQENLQKVKNNLLRIIAECPLKALVLDHHLLRDLKYGERLSEVYERGETQGIKVQTAAEFAGKRNDMLEARRRELYEKFPGKAVMNFARKMKRAFE